MEAFLTTKPRILSLIAFQQLDCPTATAILVSKAVTLEDEVTKFEVIFVRIDGLSEAEVGGSSGLAAETLEEAEREALEMRKPEGANFAKVLEEGRVVSRLGFDL